MRRPITPLLRADTRMRAGKEAGAFVAERVGQEVDMFEKKGADTGEKE